MNEVQVKPERVEPSGPMPSSSINPVPSSLPFSSSSSTSSSHSTPLPPVPIHPSQDSPPYKRPKTVPLAPLNGTPVSGAPHGPPTPTYSSYGAVSASNYPPPTPASTQPHSESHRAWHHPPPSPVNARSPNYPRAFPVMEGSMHPMPLQSPSTTLPPYAVQPHSMQSPIDPSFSHGHPPVPQGYPSGPNYPGTGTFNSSLVYQQQKVRKGARATQACNECRKRKQKCDESRPCHYCRQEGITCEYKEVPPVKSDKHMNQLHEMIKTQTETSKAQEQRIARIEESILALTRSLDRKFAGSPIDIATDAPTKVDEFTQIPNPDEKEESIIGSAPGAHSTGAHYLMSWSVIAGFFKECHIEKPDYVVQLIEKEGQFLPFGQVTSGKAKEDAAKRANLRAHRENNLNPTIPLIEFIPLPIEDQNFNPSYKTVKPAFHCQSGLTPHGDLQLDSRLLKLLFNSYVEHLWSIHPICSFPTLKKMFQSFMDKYSPVNAYGDSPASNDFSPKTGEKRKHSELNDLSVGMDRPRADIAHSLENALILMVLALGRLCSSDPFLMQDTLPPWPPSIEDLKRPNSEFSRPAQPRQPHSSYSSPTAFVKYSPTAGGVQSPDSYDTARSAPSPSSINQVREQTPNLNQVLDPTKPFNVQKLPGLAYFNLACQILGQWVGSRDMIWVQTQILAGLYWGQIGDVLKSFGYVKPAADIVCEIVHRFPDTFLKDEQLKKQQPEERREHHKELWLIIFWSLYQMEGDIRAELDHLMGSELDKMASRGINFPGRRLPGYPSDTSQIELYGYNMNVEGLMERFMGQFYVRKILNQAHTNIYGSRRGNERPVTVMWKELQKWRVFTNTTGFACWSDDDPLSVEWGVTRLRGKFYGAAYVLNRPYLYRALYPSAEDQLEMSQKWNYEELLHQTLETELDEVNIATGSKNAILAALYSTEAFDGLLTDRNGWSHDRDFVKRPKLTNIYGTLAAQFSNMLVIANAYLNDRTAPLIPDGQFLRLLHRTMMLLYRLSPCSKVFHANLCVLRCVEGQVAHRYAQLNKGKQWERFVPHGFQATPQGEPATLMPPAPTTPRGWPEGGGNRTGIESANTSFSGRMEL